MVNANRFGVIVMRGGRYDRPGLPLAGASELSRYERLVARVARSLYLRDHQQRKRAPRGFSDAISLRLTAVEQGSVAPVLERDSTDDVVLQEIPDYYEQARGVINRALRGLASTSERIDPDFPSDCLESLAALGRGLREDEVIEFSDKARGDQPARLDADVRRKVRSLAKLPSIEVEITIQGQITGLRSTPQQIDILQAGTGKKIVAWYSDENLWAQFRDYQGFGERAPMVSLSVIAHQTQSDEIVSISDVLDIEAALPLEWGVRIDELAALGDGWLDSASKAPTEGALDIAEQVLLACVDEQIPRPGIYPTALGGVQLEWALNRTEVEVEISAAPGDNVRVLWVSKVDEQEEETEVPPDKFGDLVTVIKRGINV